MFSALCSYVLSRRKRYGLLVFALSMSPVGVNLVSPFKLLEFYQLTQVCRSDMAMTFREKTSRHLDVFRPST